MALTDTPPMFPRVVAPARYPTLEKYAVYDAQDELVRQMIEDHGISAKQEAYDACIRMEKLGGIIARYALEAATVANNDPIAIRQHMLDALDLTRSEYRVVEAVARKAGA